MLWMPLGGSGHYEAPKRRRRRLCRQTQSGQLRRRGGLKRKESPNKALKKANKSLLEENNYLKLQLELLMDMLTDYSTSTLSRKKAGHYYLAFKYEKVK